MRPETWLSGREISTPIKSALTIIHCLFQTIIHPSMHQQPFYHHWSIWKQSVQIHYIFHAVVVFEEKSEGQGTEFVDCSRKNTCIR